ncbi:ribosomal RNA small subunit methyltransferase A, partial [bacterium]|nr:ribosomal RNA small subunit methyltransferase A [bacterium]
MTIAYDSPAAIRTFLEAEGLAMSKRFGQNFLVDRNARERLCAAVESASGTGEPRHVWEIGPGIGSITSLLLEKGHRVTAFEIDHGFARILRDLFGDNPRFTLVEGDVLKTWEGQLAVGLPDIVFGNLPYNVALAIVGDLLESGRVPARMVFTVQKEAAQRIVSSP